jgi:Zn finger protein HypA/HybF involved in hydrogenase expression
MFLFIGGIQPRTVNVDGADRICPDCGRPTLRLKRTDESLSLFFIPLFAVKKGEPYLVCENCGSRPGGQEEKEPGTPFRMNRRCPKCRRPLGQDFRYCPSCGEPLGDDSSEKYSGKP